MAATVVSVRRGDVIGNLKLTVSDVTFDTSYPTGGLAVTPAQLGLNQVFCAISSVKTPGANGPSEVWYDTVNSKLQAFAPTAEVSNATNLSTIVAEVTAFGD